ncbi:TRAP transporter small permease [Anaerococcus sp.]|uniref:TRAP transporter small permease n=1 Tax=Anaerococcus sp. TaxID=1872515 RepID=UPI002A7658F8|nr:TRAP transporter small permease [Anaerococcus sp.]MDD6919473.1 TRAP transporter small permease [Peptoniphilaceae bacterium]MDY2927457.1 TRAP transporter small permease [Anaerococcus sp.]
MKNYNRFFKFIDIFLGIMMGIMVVFVFLNVILRFVFNTGLASSEEVSRYTFVFMTFIGAIVAMREGEHLCVDMLVKRFPKKGQLISSIIVNVIIIIMMTILTLGSIKMVIQSSGAKTAVLGLPFSFLYSICILTGVCIGILAIEKMYMAIKHPEDFKLEENDYIEKEFTNNYKEIDQ